MILRMLDKIGKNSLKNDLQLLKRKHRESRIVIVNFMSVWVCYSE